MRVRQALYRSSISTLRTPACTGVITFSSPQVCLHRTLGAFLLRCCVALVCRSLHSMVFNGGKQVRVRAGGKSPADPCNAPFQPPNSGALSPDAKAIRSTTQRNISKLTTRSWQLVIHKPLSATGSEQDYLSNSHISVYIFSCMNWYRTATGQSLAPT
jgi:hypothetical protein